MGVTNEELAMQAQAGDGAAFEELARRNKGVIHKNAWKLWTAIGSDCNPLGAEYEDMAQIALLGLYGACMAYDPAKGFRLLSYLWRQMQSAFNGQYRQHRNDVLKEAIRADEDLSTGDDLTLMDMIPCEQAAQAFEDSEEELWRQQARHDLERAIDGLAPQPAAAVRQRYFEGRELRPIGDYLGISTERARQLVQRGLQGLRRDKRLMNGYRDQFTAEYVEAKAYRSTGAGAFRNKRASSVELLTEKLEWLREFRGQTDSEGLKQSIDREIAAVTARLAS